MPAKEIRLEGYGKIFINTINVEDVDYDTVDQSGQPLTHKMVGRGKSVYMTQDGTEVPSSSVCKKIVMDDGEVIIAPKFSQTKEVMKQDIELSDDNSMVYNAIEKKLYNVTTDSAEIKELVLKQHKTLIFPFCAGNGWKLWNTALTYWNNKLIMVGCRGDLTKELEKYDEDTVEIKLEMIPQQQNMKRLVKAMVR